MIRRPQVGAIAVSYVNHLLVASMSWRKDEDLSVVLERDCYTRVPKGAEGSRTAAKLVLEFTEEQAAGPWRYHKPRPSAAQRGQSRRMKAMAQLMSLIIPKPGKRQLTTAQVERLVGLAKRSAKTAARAA